MNVYCVMEVSEAVYCRFIVFVGWGAVYRVFDYVEVSQE